MLPVRQTPDAFLSLDHAGRVLYASPEAGALVAVPAQELVGTILWERWPALGPLASAFRVALATATPAELELTLPAGTERAVARIVPSGQTCSIYVRTLEAVERGGADLERYRAFIALSSEGIWRFELAEPISAALPIDDQIDWFYAHAYLAECNDAMARMYGFSHAADLVGIRLADILPRSEPRNVAYLREFVASGYQLRGGESVEFDAQGQQQIFSNTLTGIVEDGMVVRAWGTQHDITDRKRAEAALAASEERYRVLATYATDMISHHAADGTFLYVSPSVEKLLGYQPAELLATSPYTLVHPDDVATLQAAHRRIGATPEFETVTHRIRHKHGHYVWIESVARAFSGAADGTTEILSVSRDVTHRQGVEQQLRDSEARYRALSEAIPQIIFTTSAAGVTEYVNQRWLDYSGLTLQASLEHGWADALHPDDRPRLAAAWRQAAATSQPCEAECRIRRHDGVYCWFLMRTLPLLDDAGRVVRWYGAATDITERKRMEDELRRREQEYKTLVQNAPDIIARFDRSFRHVYVSPAVQGATGLPPDDVIGRTNRELGMPASVNDSWERSIAAVFATGKPLSLDLTAETASGTRYYEARIVPELTSYNHVETVLAITRDVTKRKRAEEDRAALLTSEQQAREKAEAAVHVRDLFLSMAAHELKNPLTTLLGNVELLKRRMQNDPNVAERHRTMAVTLRDQLLRFNRSINTILDISLIQGGQFTVDRAPLDLGALARRVVETIEPTLDRHCLALHIAEAPLMVDGDELRLEQVLQNLVTNAVKYSPRGGAITVEIARSGQSICLSVADEGIGIPEDALPHLFEHFYRAGNAEPNKIGGMGIGLFVVKQIVTLHGGTVTARSGPGGSTFEVCLPALEYADAACASRPDIDRTLPA